jgi:thiamine pyrophosphate-dependent acetolactate synthase large subunit-like protein
MSARTVAIKPVYGSDLVVDLLRAFGIEYVAANPGATFRGLHESLANFAPGEGPELIEACHEEIAVSIAHGYAKATGRPMAVALHNVVGLTHAAMAIFNAYCDRMPVLLLGGTGPMDVTLRRPWIDWVHTAFPQSEPVRPFLKWDDQPVSPAAAVESFVQGYRIMMADPPGPVYQCYDVLLQEEALTGPLLLPSPLDFPAPTAPGPDPSAIARAAGLLASAQHPVIIAEGLGFVPEAGALVEAVATRLAAPILEVTRTGSSVRNTFALDLTGSEVEVLAEADVILAVGVRDLEAAVSRTDDGNRQVRRLHPPGARIIDIGQRLAGVRGWLAETGRPVPVAECITARPDHALRALVQRLDARAVEHATGDGSGAQDHKDRAAMWAESRRATRERWEQQAVASRSQQPIALSSLALAVRDAFKGRAVVLANGTANTWARRLWDWDRPDFFLGDSGGYGKGYAPGGALGVALAYRRSDRIVVDLQGDGDLLYTPSALWTAAHHRIPLLIIVLNNRSYYQDEGHQRRLAQARSRSVERALAGTRIEDPAVEFAALARSMGVFGIGPVQKIEELPAALEAALRVVTDQRLPALVDVITQPR